MALNWLDLNGRGVHGVAHSHLPELLATPVRTLLVVQIRKLALRVARLHKR